MTVATEGFSNPPLATEALSDPHPAVKTLNSLFLTDAVEHVLSGTPRGKRFSPPAA